MCKCRMQHEWTKCAMMNWYVPWRIDTCNDSMIHLNVMSIQIRKGSRLTFRFQLLFLSFCYMLLPWMAVGAVYTLKRGVLQCFVMCCSVLQTHKRLLWFELHKPLSHTYEKVMSPKWRCELIMSILNANMIQSCHIWIRLLTCDVTHESTIAVLNCLIMVQLHCSFV